MGGASQAEKIKTITIKSLIYLPRWGCSTSLTFIHDYLVDEIFNIILGEIKHWDEILHRLYSWTSLLKIPKKTEKNNNPTTNYSSLFDLDRAGYRIVISLFKRK